MIVENVKFVFEASMKGTFDCVSAPLVNYDVTICMEILI